MGKGLYIWWYQSLGLHGLMKMYICLNVCNKLWVLHVKKGGNTLFWVSEFMLSVLFVGDSMEPAQLGYFSYKSFKFHDFKKAWWNATFFWLILCRYYVQDHHELLHTERVRVFLSLLPISRKWRELVASFWLNFHVRGNGALILS